MVSATDGSVNSVLCSALSCDAGILCTLKITCGGGESEGTFFCQDDGSRTGEFGNTWFPYPHPPLFQVACDVKLLELSVVWGTIVCKH